ncbi:uncharacterized protein LOC134178985 [Corticium candelabrum]|uniref:uncharacterized protein LOC134178985 n=1 Tax=Corticium candelabrum TaxID=121492 RepID=UPI002E269271|nr:uncharacterized protein LOC134178985 [Corticium candelabrum]
MKGGEFSLTKCRLPNVDGCTDSRPSPNWLVAEFEYLSSKAPFRSTVSKLHLYGTCKSNFIRLACTKPSCESNNRMRCYKNRAECNDFLNCISNFETKQILEKSLLCDVVDHFRNPSTCAGKTRSCHISNNDATIYRDAHKSTDDVSHKDSHDGCDIGCYIGFAAGCPGALFLLAVVAVIAEKKEAAGRRYGAACVRT